MCALHGDHRTGPSGVEVLSADHPLPDPVGHDRDRGAQAVEVERAGDVVVIGDTPLDVQCAAAAGARSVAVATGSYDEAALRATGAHAVLADLSDADTVVDLLLEPGR